MRVDGNPFGQDTRVSWLSIAGSWPDLVLLPLLVVNHREWWLRVLVRQLLDEVEFHCLVGAQLLVVHLVRHLVNLLHDHFLVEGAICFAGQEFPVHYLEGVRDRVVLSFEGPVARQDRVVDALDEDHFVEGIELLLELLVPPLDVSWHFWQGMR